MKDLFVYDGYFPLIFILVLIAGILIAGLMRTRRAIALWFTSSEVAGHFPRFRFASRIGGFVLIFIALLGPVWGRVEQELSVMGREVIFLIDLSASMSVEDVGSSRLNKVKKELRKVFVKLHGDRMGLITFTDDPFVQCPLTQDISLLTTYLDIIGSDDFRSKGTDLRSALSAALNRFENSNSGDLRAGRAVVLLSDGEDWGGAFVSVLERMKENNIFVFPVGVGTTQGGRVPNMVGKVKSGYLSNEDGTPAVSRRNDQTLQQIATRFGVNYSLLDNPASDLNSLVDELRNIPASILDRETQMSEINRFQWFLGPGILLIFISMFMMPRGRKTQTLTESTFTEADKEASPL